MGDSVYIGVDVGSFSARAIAVNSSGNKIGHASLPIKVNKPEKEHYEQSSEDIWKAVCTCVKEACSTVPKNARIAGIGFDATCSLVVLDEALHPVSVNKKDGDPNWNIMMWMDHRASGEADFINSKNHNVLQYLGEKISLEMQVPKLLWLKKNLPETWTKAKHLLDLPDFLTMKASGTFNRSLCSLVCKWTYIHDGSKQSWDTNFLKDVGLEDLVVEDFAKIGKFVLPPGALNGTLSASAAVDLGIPEGIPVGTSMIDAHAGALPLLSAGYKHLSGENKGFDGILGMICGTSTCHMLLSKERQDVPGVWGPYYNAILPQYWAAEAGQCASGSLIDYMLQTHPAAIKLKDNKGLPNLAESFVAEMVKSRGLDDACTLTEGLHVYPDFHGNRSPLADCCMKGMASGLSLCNGEEDMGIKYLATIQALAYGTRAIVEQLRKFGHTVSCTLLCGGLAQSKLFLQTHADVLGMEVLVPHQQQESVVLGAAMLGASAALDGDLEQVLSNMEVPIDKYAPNPRTQRYHEKKYKVFCKMQNDQLEYKKIMQSE